MQRLFVVCALLIGASSVARAERVAIVNLTLTDATDAEDAAVRAAVDRALKAAGAETVPAAQVEAIAASAKKSFDCFAEDRCKVDIGSQLLADTILTGSIRKEDQAWVANLAMFDVGIGAVTERAQLACPRCTEAQLEQKLGPMMASLLKGHRAFPRGTLAIRTRPPGAEAKVDGRPVGVTNVEVAVAAGEHTVELSRPGGQPISLPVRVGRSHKKEVEIGLPLVGAAQPPPETTPKPVPGPEQPVASTRGRNQRIAGGVLIAAGLVVAVVGVSLLAVNGQCTTADCLYTRDTIPSGAGLLAAGAVVAVVGGVVVGTAPRGAVKQALLPAIGPNGGGVVWSLVY